MKARPPIYGLLAEFHTPEELLAAARKLRETGYRKVDAYSPYPVEGLSEAIGFHRTRLPYVVLTGGLVGCAAGFLLQYYAAVISYPLNVGGRPLNSWPSFVPITFEMTVLVAALTAVLAMLAMNGLPQPYHPLFNVERFAMASRDRFFIAIEATDPKFDRQKSREFLESLTSYGVFEVEH
jgi:hypothetical protein